jgi:hypothetical protein
MPPAIISDYGSTIEVELPASPRASTGLSGGCPRIQGVLQPFCKKYQRLTGLTERTFATLAYNNPAYLTLSEWQAILKSRLGPRFLEPSCTSKTVR